MAETTFMVRPVEFRNTSGDIIFGDLRFLPEARRRPLIIICHSFMAFKDWGFFPYLGGRLAESGFVTFLFNFSHNGAGDSQKIADVELFERNTFSKELEDLRCVVEFFTREENDIGDVWDPARIILMGHSRGGGISILHSAHDARVRGLISLGAIAFLDRWTDHQKHIWRERGFYPLARDSTTSPLRLGAALLDDLENNREILDIGLAASRIRCPWLILHGDMDLTVPVREAEELYARSDRETTTLKIVPHTGHLFNAGPSSGDGYATLEAVIGTVRDWLHNHY